MALTGNYLIQADQAKRRFLTYDQPRIIEKFGLSFDEHYIYVNFLCQLYRVDRSSGDLYRLLDGQWVDGNSYEEVMTLLDLLCDSREDRCLSGRWKNMSGFGLQFHQNLLEEARDPDAELFDRDPAALAAACEAMGGTPLPNCDVGYAIELFDGLRIGLQFWRGDDEFAPRLRYLWDENAKQYLRYETMYFATSLLLRRIKEVIGKGKCCLAD